MLAQRFPEDFDGIMAAAPAINWSTFVPAGFWPQLLMSQIGVYPELCEFDALREAAIQACDDLDGVKDRVLSAPGACDFDPLSVVGQPYDCHGILLTITKEAAILAQKIWQGPARPDNHARRWYGLNPDASFWLLPRVVCAENDGTKHCSGRPFEITEKWLRLFVINDPEFDPSGANTVWWISLCQPPASLFSPSPSKQTELPDVSKRSYLLPPAA